MFDLVIKDGNLVATEEVKKALADYREKELTIEEMKDDMKELNDAVMQAMVNNNVKNIQVEDADGVVHNFTYKAAYTRTGADTEKMKADGIFKEYMKTTDIKESILHKTE